MSLADLKAFAKKCVDDKAIGEKAKKIGTKNTDGLIKYAGELGFTVTKKDIAELKKEAEGSDVLTADQLAAISGGANDPEVPIPMTEEERKRLRWHLDPSHW
jgi:predicted ribosomally synthesized peptide with nif11-like leader